MCDLSLVRVDACAGNGTRRWYAYDTKLDNDARIIPEGCATHSYSFICDSTIVRRVTPCIRDDCIGIVKTRKVRGNTRRLSTRDLKLLYGNKTALLSVYPLCMGLTSTNIYDMYFAAAFVPYKVTLPDVEYIRSLRKLIEESHIKDLLSIQPNSFRGNYNSHKFKTATGGRNGLCAFVPLIGTCDSRAGTVECFHSEIEPVLQHEKLKTAGNIEPDTIQDCALKQCHHLVYTGVALDYIKKQCSRVEADIEYEVAMKDNKDDVLYAYIDKDEITQFITQIENLDRASYMHANPLYGYDRINKCITCENYRSFINNTNKIYKYINDDNIIVEHIKSILRELYTRRYPLRDVHKALPNVDLIVKECLYDFIVRQIHKTKPYGNIITQRLYDSTRDENMVHYFVRSNDTNGQQIKHLPLIGDDKKELLSTERMKQTITSGTPTIGNKLFTEIREGGLSTTRCTNTKVAVSNGFSDAVPVVYSEKDKNCLYILTDDKAIDDMDYIALSEYVFNRYSNFKVAAAVTDKYTLDIKQHGLVRYSAKADDIDNTVHKRLSVRVPINKKEMIESINSVMSHGASLDSELHTAFFCDTKKEIPCKFVYNRSDDVSKAAIFELLAPDFYMKHRQKSEPYEFYVIPLILTTGNAELHLLNSMFAIPTSANRGIRHFYINAYIPNTVNAYDYGNNRLLEYSYSHYIENGMRLPLSVNAVAMNRSFMESNTKNKKIGRSILHLVVN